MNALKTLPLVLFLLIVILLWRGLGLHPSQVPSPLINKAAPNFQLPTLNDGKTSNKDFLGHVTLLNVWATWCFACEQEHQVLLDLAKNENINFYGLNYKDDMNAAKAWIIKNGNPYQIIAIDQTGDVAIDFGVYGTPETFIIDKKGLIRYKQIGPITVEIWQKTLKPIVEKLKRETP